VEIKRIDDEEARHVCFSKRRQGLFNKANELSILCGAIVGVVVFSISGRAYSIGHPSIDAVIKRFFAPKPPNVPATSGGGANQDGGEVSDTVRLLCEQHEELQGLVEEELKRKDSLQEAIDKEMGSPVMQWLRAKVYDLGQDELQELYKELQAMRGVVLGKENQMMAEAMQNPSSLSQPPTVVATALPSASPPRWPRACAARREDVLAVLWRRTTPGPAGRNRPRGPGRLAARPRPLLVQAEWAIFAAQARSPCRFRFMRQG
jgi:hypothetical protein